FVSARQVRAVIRTRLPLGSDKTQVIQFLKNLGWQPSRYYPAWDLMGQSDLVPRKRLQDGVTGGVIYGSVRNEICLGHNVRLAFIFDKKGRLVEYKAEDF